MKVILKQDIKGVGKKDQIIEAADGYARNYLFPKDLAVEATSGNLTKLNEKKTSEKHKKELEKEHAEELKQKIEKLVLEIKVKAGENGKIFGGVSSKEIAEHLKLNCQIDIDKKKIVLNETIKMLGVTVVEIKLYEGIAAKLNVNVIG